MQIDLARYQQHKLEQSQNLAGATFGFTGLGQKTIGTFTGHYWVAVEKKINQEPGDVIMVAKAGVGDDTNESSQFIVNLRHWTTAEQLKVSLPSGGTYMISNGKRVPPPTI